MALFKSDKLDELKQREAAREGAKRHHVLIVDDEQDNLRVLSDLLSDEYHVHNADSGFAGLKVLESTPIDLIITDQRMPVMTGVVFLGQTVLAYPRCVRLILTGYTDVDAIVQAINHGRVHGYLTKPWDPRELMITLRRSLEAYELERRVDRQREAVAKRVPELWRALDSIVKKAADSEVETIARTARDVLADIAAEVLHDKRG